MNVAFHMHTKCNMRPVVWQRVDADISMRASNFAGTTCGFTIALALSCISHDLSILFFFSLRFSRSTLFLCIFSAIFSYRSFSSLAARRSLMPCTLRYSLVSPIQIMHPASVYIPVVLLLFQLSSPSPASWSLLPLPLLRPAKRTISGRQLA